MSMKTRATRGLSSGVLIALVTLVAVLQGCGSRDEGTPVPSLSSNSIADTVICSFFPVTQRDGTVTQEPEYYILSAMNRKLQYFPEFANAIGMASASDCDSARKFYSAYLTYLRSHPGFDLGLPVAAHTPLESFAKHQTPTVSKKKVFNGASSGLSAVVQLSYIIPVGTFYWDHLGPNGGLIPTSGQKCSGTFIAKNWLLTSAHCIGKIALRYNPSTLKNQNPWINSYQWTIEFSDSTGTINDAVTVQTNVTAIVDPNYIGVTSSVAPAYVLDTQESPPHDAALLYIDPVENDGLLPPDASKSSLYVSTAPVDTSWTLTDYGYGGTSESGTKVGMQTSAVISSQYTASPLGYIQEQIPAASFTFGSVCHGDSGGPLVRDVGSGLLAIVGINSGVSSPVVPGSDAAPANCGDATGTVVYWTRADMEVDFIQGVLQPDHTLTPDQAMMFPPCALLPNGTGNTGNTYMQCWGAPCAPNAIPAACPMGDYCSAPALDPNSPFQGSRASECQECPKPGDCSCIVGQCLRSPVSSGYPVDYDGSFDDDAGE